jgi:hypothetical protein
MNAIVGNILAPKCKASDARIPANIQDRNKAARAHPIRSMRDRTPPTLRSISEPTESPASPAPRDEDIFYEILECSSAEASKGAEVERSNQFFSHHLGLFTVNLAFRS